MDPIDLIFEEPSPGNPRPLDLVFGALDTSTSAQSGTLAVALPLPAFNAVADYDVNNAHRMYGGAQAGWQVGRNQNGSLATAWDRGGRAERGEKLPWGEADPVRVQVETSFDRNLPQRVGKSYLWTEAVGRRVESAAPHQDGLRHIRPQGGGAWQDGVARRVQSTAPHQERLRHVRPEGSTSWDDALRATKDLLARIGRGAKRDTSRLLPWEIARRAPAGISDTGTVTPPVDPPCYIPPPAHAVELLFDEAWSGASTTIIFKCRTDTEGTVVVPVRNVYIVINTTSLIRMSDGRAIPVLAASASLDVDSWVWTFNAQVPADQMQYVDDPDDMLQITVNGTPFAFMPERLSRTRSFGEAAVAVQGRGRQALLDSPYSPTQNFINASARTANQLVSDVLTVNGVPMGTTVAWNLTDWLVPANAFSHQGSYITAVNAIAAAAGGYVQPENLSDGLRILHRYPVMPWEWATATADFSLPSSVVVQESIEWTNRMDYNRVFVSGTTAGALARVTRTGTDGLLLAPMVTDPLITAVEAATQRGKAVLGATGRSAMVSLRLPVLQTTGVIRPGALVTYNDGAAARTGMVRSTNWSIEGAETWQTIGVETYEPV